MVNTQVRQTTCLFTNKWRLFLTITEVTLCTQTAGNSSFGTLKRLTEGTVLQNWHLYLVNVIKPAIISEHFRVAVPDTYIWKKTTWFTCAPVLPCCLCTETMEWNRNGKLQRLPIFTECKLWRKKFWVGGKTGGSVGFLETKTFFFFA